MIIALIQIMDRFSTDNSEVSLKSYFDEISRFQLLDSQQELDYSKRIEDGDNEALDSLINSNLRLVVKIAKNYGQSEHLLMDLIQEGNLGLIKAAGKYDYRKKIRFSTYASWWIKQSIQRMLNEQIRTVRLPLRKEEKLRKLKKLAHDFCADFSRQPSVDELAELACMNTDQVQSIIDLDSSSLSLDSKNSTDNNSLLDLIEDHTYVPDKDLLRKNFQEDTHRFLRILRDQEKKVIVSRFALDGGKKKTFKVIAQDLGLSAESVRQLEIKAMKKLRHEARSFREYMLN